MTKIDISTDRQTDRQTERQFTYIVFEFVIGFFKAWRKQENTFFLLDEN